MNQVMSPFGQALEAVDQLSVDEQQEVVEIVQRRLHERRRARLIEEVRQAEEDYRAGRCKEATAEEIMAEIRS